VRLRGIVTLGLAALFVAALAVPRLVGGRGETASAAPAAGTEPPLAVEVVRVEPRTITERLSTTGTLRANESVDLVSEVAGIVERIHFEEGAAVAKDELLVEIEDAELRAQRERVVHRLRLAEIREARQHDLRRQGIVSEQDYDLASSELNVLRAELRLVEAQLEKTEIRAPFAGVIGLRYVSTGSLLSPQTRIATLQDLDPLKVDFTLPEKYAGRIGPGERVDFRVEGADGARVAEVYAVEPRIVQETRSLLVRARTPNPDGALLPGAFADVELAVEEIPDAVVVPSLAVVPELGGKKVFVLDGGVAQPRAVETGIRTETEIQITAGLEPGDQVIVSAIQRLRPGLPVKPGPPAEADGIAR
jgi:membrane fusion protein (multidrug efflux system)